MSDPYKQSLHKALMDGVAAIRSSEAGGYINKADADKLLGYLLDLWYKRRISDLVADRLSFERVTRYLAEPALRRP